MTKEVSNIIIDAKGKVNEKNLTRLHTTVKDLIDTVTKQAEHIQRLEANVAMLAADIANTKQMVGFLHGRGTGPSVKPKD